MIDLRSDMSLSIAADDTAMAGPGEVAENVQCRGSAVRVAPATCSRCEGSGFRPRLGIPRATAEVFTARLPSYAFGLLRPPAFRVATERGGD